MTASSQPRAQLYCAICEQQFDSGDRCPDDGTKLVRLAAADDPLLGRDLDGRFTILEKLGQGGMGAVYRAKQHSMGREVAIKVVSPGLVSDPPTIKRFLREAKLASRLAHPNIVAVFEFGQTGDGLFYLVMELVDGRTLHHIIHDEGRIAPARLVRIGSQICDALEGAHALPIVHRDLKPANVMLLAHGRDLVKVLDFGLAKSLSPDTSSVSTMTSAGALMGTPTFMPPEVANGLGTDHRADLYSLGCILYLMGAGRPPFVTDSIPEMIAMHGTQPAPPMTGVPAPLAHVIDRLLRKDPMDRYPSAAALRTALEDAHDASRAQVALADTMDDELVEPGELTKPSLVIESPRSNADAREGVTTPYLVPDVSLGDGSVIRAPSHSAMRPSLPVVLEPPLSSRRLVWLALGGLLVVAGVVVFVLARDGKRDVVIEYVVDEAIDAAPAAVLDAEPVREVEIAIDAGDRASDPPKPHDNKRHSTKPKPHPVQPPTAPRDAGFARPLPPDAPF